MLNDLCVVELGDLVAVPRAGKLFAQLGAEVIKVEPPERGDRARRHGPFPGDIPDVNASGLFLALNGGKQSLTLDVGVPTGRWVLNELLHRADVLLHDLRPSELAALQLDHSMLREAHPRLVIGALTGYGQTGPHAEWQATDLTSFHHSGVGHRFLGSAEERPLRVPAFYADTLASLTLVHAVMVALTERDRSGTGQVVDVSSVETMASVVLSYCHVITHHEGGDVGTRSSEERASTRSMVPSGRFPCSDGDVHLSAPDPAQWRALVGVMGSPGWATSGLFGDDPQSRAQHPELISELVGDWTRERSRQEVFDVLQAAGIPCVIYERPEGNLRSPQLRARKAFQTVTDGSGGNWELPGAPWRMSGQDAGPSLVPALSQDTNAILGKLGLSPQEIESLRVSGVV